MSGFRRGFYLGLLWVSFVSPSILAQPETLPPPPPVALGLPTVPPIRVREAAALPLRIVRQREEVDGYIVERIEIRSSEFTITAPGAAEWAWESVDANTVRARRLGLEDAAFTIEVFPASAAFPERPWGYREMGGYLEGLRLDWERNPDHTFEILLNTAADVNSLKMPSGPVIYDRNGNPRGNTGRVRREKLWGYPFQKIGYVLTAEEPTENGEEPVTTTTRCYEWWVEAPQWSGHASFACANPRDMEVIQRIAEEYLRSVLFIPHQEARATDR